MKVLLVNGSPREQGCTNTALETAKKVFEAQGVESEIFWIGAKVAGGCMHCLKCRENNECIIDDVVNKFHKLARSADGFIFGSPVHYASISGGMSSFMDRLFFSDIDKIFRMKPAGAIVSARRAGTTAAFDQMNKYFTISEMPVISSVYWNMVHGSNPEEVLQDEEGIFTVEQLAKNMVFILKCIQAGKEQGIALPEKLKRPATNFIR